MRLNIPGLSAVRPKAGLYIFPKIDRNMYRIDDDEQLSLFPNRKGL